MWFKSYEHFHKLQMDGRTGGLTQLKMKWNEEKKTKEKKRKGRDVVLNDKQNV